MKRKRGYRQQRLQNYHYISVWRLRAITGLSLWTGRDTVCDTCWEVVGRPESHFMSGNDFTLLSVRKTILCLQCKPSYSGESFWLYLKFDFKAQSHSLIGKILSLKRFWLAFVSLYAFKHILKHQFIENI